MNDFLKKMFIDEAKPALNRHSGTSGSVDVNKETLDVTVNGTYTPSGENTYFEEVNVNVQPPLETLEITENGTHNVSDYKKADVNIEVGVFPSGTLNITENGTHDVTNYQNTNVNVPIPEGYIKPKGDLKITENGTHDVTSKATVSVDIDGIVPSGVLDITENGYYNVAEKANVAVNVGESPADVGTFKKYLDDAKTTYYLFSAPTVDDLSGYLSYDDTSSVTNMDHMFVGNSSVTTIPSMDTSKVTSMRYMFQNCSKLKNVPAMNTSNVTDMTSMFSGCSSLVVAPEMDTSNVTSMQQMFYGCKKLTTIPDLNTDNVTNTQYMFQNCNALVTIPPINMINVTGRNSAYLMFNKCTSLKNLTLYNIQYDLTIGSGNDYGHLLTVESLINTCKECIKETFTLTLTVGSANLSKLSNVYVKFTDTTQTEIAVDEKGEVEVCESTDEGAMTITEYMALKSWTLA